MGQDADQAILFINDGQMVGAGLRGQRQQLDGMPLCAGDADLATHDLAYNFWPFTVGQASRAQHALRSVSQAVVVVHARVAQEIGYRDDTHYPAWPVYHR